MFTSRKRSAFIVLGLTIFASLGSKAGNPPNDAAPSLDTLKTVDYTRSANTEQNDAMGYSALRVLIDACQTYLKGLDALPGFHDANLN